LLAIFDLDYTILEGDCEHTWGHFLIETGLLTKECFAAIAAKQMADYEAGCLNIGAYLQESLAPLATLSLTEQQALRLQFLDKIKPMVREKARMAIETHRAARHTLVLASASNQFLAEPIAHYLGFDDVHSSQIATRDGRFYPKLIGAAPFQAGKRDCLIQAYGETQLRDAVFYSDSHNDLPLLRYVREPRVVTPDTTLEQVAKENGWPILDWS